MIEMNYFQKVMKLIIWMFCLFSIILISCAPKKTLKDDCMKYADTAEDFLRYGMVDSALIYLEKTVACSSEFVDAYLLMGSIYERREQNSLAEETYISLIKNIPKSPKGWIELGNLYLEMEKYEKTIDTYNNALSLHPSNVSIYHGLGSAYEKQKNYIKARELYEKAIDLNPENEPIWYALSKVYLELGLCEKAIPILEKQSKNFPNDIELKMMLGDAHYDCKNYSQALEKYKIMQPDLAESGTIYIKIAQCHEGLREYSNAVEYFLIAIEKSHNKLIPHYHLINMYIKINQYSNAKKCITQAFVIAPDGPGLTTMMGDVYIGYGDMARKKENYVTAIKHYKTAKEWYIKANAKREDRRADAKINNIYHTTGKIAGRVIDKSNGESLPFTVIVILGTKKGASSNLNGEYYIILTPGTYDIQARMLGYKNNTTSNIQVEIGQTTNVNFELILMQF